MSVLGLLMLAAPTFSQAASSRAKGGEDQERPTVVIKKQRRARDGCPSITICQAKKTGSML
jgi:hypothetical protein